jgi:hypothetical protein
MLNTRIYRTALLPALAAIAVLMFSLEPMPAPLTEPISTPEFDSSEATRIARSIAAATPDRTPGSPGDADVADLVEERFRDVVGGLVGRQTVESELDGEEVTSENVVLTIPGQSEEAVLLVAARDTLAGEGSGAATSAAATATLLTIVEAIGNSRHERTLVLASTASSGDGAAGVRELIGGLELPGEVAAAIVITQPGVKLREPPFVYPGRARDEAVPPVLIETADTIAARQFGEDATPSGAWTAYARLAVPFGVGQASALAEEGVATVAVSGGGERPPSPEEADAGVAGETLFMTGTTTLDLLLTLDESDRAVARGPDEYVPLGSNLIPGWAFKVLALTLILPSLLTAIDIWVRDRRRNPRPARRSVGWTLERILVPLAALLSVYILGLTGLIPGPSFPYDPASVEAGISVPVAFGIMLGAALLVALLIRPMRTPLDSEPQTLAAAAGILGCVALLGLWFLNPYMALLLAPTAHIWLLPARASGPPRPRRIALAAILSLAPAVAALVAVGAALDLGLETPWHLILMVVDGHLGFPAAFLWCAVFGGLLACVGAAGAAKPPEIGSSRAAPGSVRGPAGYAGPGSLGGTPSSLSGR